MQAFHGDPAVKAKYVARVKAHREADEIVQGRYWENGKGCAVGCTIHGDDHQRYETELGIPESLARLQDSIFEGLTPADAKEFPLRFLEVIPVGKDLSKTEAHFMLWLLGDGADCFGLAAYVDDAGKACLERVAGLWQRRRDGDEPSVEEWVAASYAASAAAKAASAAANYAASYAASAAAKAASAAARAARAAAWAASYAAKAARAAAWAAACKKIADKLIELLAA